MALKISNKGWVVIPAELRKKYDLKPGDEVQIVDYGGVLALVPSLEAPVEGSAGVLKGKRSLSEALLKERRADYKREG